MASYSNVESKTDDEFNSGLNPKYLLTRKVSEEMRYFLVLYNSRAKKL